MRRLFKWEDLVMKTCLTYLGLLIVLGCGATTIAPSAPKKNEASQVDPLSVTNTDSNSAATTATANENPQTVATIPDPARPSGEVTIIPFSDLAEAYKADQGLAKYADQTIETTVFVSDIGGGMAFADDGSETDAAVISVGIGESSKASFWTNRKTQQPWARIAPKQVVTLRREKSVTPGANSNGWDIVKSGGNIAPILTAKALTEEFEQNRVLAGQKYHLKPIYVSGRVSRKTPGGFNKAVEITLAGSGINVILYCPSLPVTESIVVGQDIHVIGMVDVIASLFPGANKRDVVLNSGMPVTIPFPVKGVKYPDSMASANRERAKQIHEATPDFKFTAVDLARELADGSKDHEKLYGGKLLEISGIIKSYYSQSYADKIVLDGDSDGRNIVCEPFESEPWKIYSPSQEVTVRGHYSPSGDIIDVTVISAKPLSEPLTTFMAKELVSLYAKDLTVFQEKWAGKSVEVVGKLKSVTATTFELEAAEEMALVCTFATAGSDEKTPDRIRFEQHTIGDQVQIIATIDPDNSEPKVLQLKNAWDRTPSK
jgi:hypothetical protein